jgi:hypothetical protein
MQRHLHIAPFRHDRTVKQAIIEKRLYQAPDPAGLCGTAQPGVEGLDPAPAALLQFVARELESRCGKTWRYFAP